MLPNPEKIYMNVTKKCNLACDHCYSTSGLSNQDMDFSYAASLVDEVKPRRIGISGGEPLMVAERLADFIGSYSPDIQTTVYTNGLLIEDKLATLRDKIDVLKINFPASTRETYRIVNGADVFDAVVKGTRIAVDSGIKIVLNTILKHQNKDEMGGIVDYAADEGVGEVNVLRIRPSGRTHRISLTPHDVMTAYQNLIDAGKERGVVIDLHDPLANIFGIEVRCAAATGYLNVDTGGELGPCPFFNKSVQGDFNYAWNESDLFKASRETAEECADCEVDNCDGGCKAMTMNVSGRVEKDPFCFKDLMESD